MPGGDENVRNSDEAAAEHPETDGQDAEEAKGSSGCSEWWVIEPGSRASSRLTAEVSEFSSAFSKLSDAALEPWIHFPFWHAESARLRKRWSKCKPNYDDSTTTKSTKWPPDTRRCQSNYSGRFGLRTCHPSQTQRRQIQWLEEFTEGWSCHPIQLYHPVLTGFAKKRKNSSKPALTPKPLPRRWPKPRLRTRDTTRSSRISRQHKLQQPLRPPRSHGHSQLQAAADVQRWSPFIKLIELWTKIVYVNDKKCEL